MRALMPLPKPHLLIVDDDSDTRLLIGANLKQIFDFEISEAQSASEAISKLEVCDFQFILCDLFMIHDSGLDLFAHLKNQPKFNSHFIMFTGSASSLTQAQRKEIIVIEKPDFSGLLKAIELLRFGRN